MERLVELPDIIESKTAGRRSNLLRNIDDGLFPPGVKIGRSRCWPEYEVIALQKARIRGDSDEQIRDLVKELLERRKALPKFGEPS